MIDSFSEATPAPYLSIEEGMFLEKIPYLNINREKGQLSHQLSGQENELVEFYELTKSLQGLTVSKQRY